jgi:hypothetical protein
MAYDLVEGKMERIKINDDTSRYVLEVERIMYCTK